MAKHSPYDGEYQCHDAPARTWGAPAQEEVAAKGEVLLHRVVSVLGAPG